MSSFVQEGKTALNEDADFKIADMLKNFSGNILFCIIINKSAGSYGSVFLL